MRRPSLPVVLTFLVPWLGARSATAQTTNAEVLSTLVVECVVPASAGSTEVLLEGLSDAPFARSALVQAWQAAGVAVFEAGSSAPGATRVAVSGERLSVEYERAEGGHYRRLVRVRVRTGVTAHDGRIIHDSTCDRDSTDLVRSDKVSSLEDPAFPQTRAERPAHGFFRRVLQPAVVGAATAVGVFLFFSLRSRRAGTGE